jgi:hypothetical protein
VTVTLHADHGRVSTGGFQVTVPRSAPLAGTLDTLFTLLGEKAGLLAGLLG